MPELSLTDSIITSLNENVKLFQPYEVEQILLPDNASCLAVQAFLKICNLPFEVEMRWNAEFMSPSGRVPFIKCGAFVVSELEPVVQFAANKGVTLCGRLSTEEKAEMRAYMSLITNVLVNAELYISWLDEETFNAVTKVRNSSVYPWPLGWLQTRAKRNAVAKRLKALNWHDKTLEQVLADVEQCCSSLSQRLGDRDYFFGTSLCEDHCDFMSELMDEIIDKVHEIANEDKHDFEMLVYPTENCDDDCTRISRTNDYLDTIDENDDLNDNDPSIRSPEVRFTSDADSDGVVNDKLLGEDVVVNDDYQTVSVSLDVTESRPTELDALVFGHVFTIITTRLPCRKLAEAVRRHESLVSLAKRVDEKYFKRP
ncbi:unnamed protein product [Chilo suppressalis]|uniref:Metaxin-2 n=1 Tax=Chilo suppressalis TaxID=168631 RepID=A0ABN8BBQ5_CHISP|nr:unnamed protein product [Chilo suppressalis]